VGYRLRTVFARPCCDGGFVLRPAAPAARQQLAGVGFIPCGSALPLPFAGGTTMSMTGLEAFDTIVHKTNASLNELMLLLYFGAKRVTAGHRPLTRTADSGIDEVKNMVPTELRTRWP